MNSAKGLKMRTSDENISAITVRTKINKKTILKSMLNKTRGEKIAIFSVNASFVTVQAIFSHYTPLV